MFFYFINKYGYKSFYELLNKIDAEASNFFGKPNDHQLYGVPTLILVSTKIPQKQGSISPYCNAACIVENMSLTATDLGLGNVYILGAITALRKSTELCEAVKLPKDFVPTSSLAVGFASGNLERRELTLSKIKIDYLR